MSTNILGLSALFHDSAAALVQDGEIVAAAQEERFTRKKADAGFPVNAVTYCLAEARLHISQLDYIVFYERPATKFERIMASHASSAPFSFRSFLNAFPMWGSERLYVSELIVRSLPGRGFRGEILFSGHHESHAASAFFPSPFDEAAILTIDAVGEWGTSAIGIGCGSRLELSQEVRFPHSLGMLYSAFTYYAGFKVNSGEYKLMGLAPYGQPKYVDKILKTVVALEEDGSLHLNMDFFGFWRGTTITSERFHTEFGGPPRRGETPISQKEMDLAASIQVVCEEAVLRSARQARLVTGAQNLVMAGGVALNCVANGRLVREGPFDRIWVQPAAGDAGGALGAALSVWYQTLGNPRSASASDAQKGSFLGPSFEGGEIEVFLDSVGATYDRAESESALLDRVAGLLEDEHVVGWFQGRMEFGPRALGHRSILGDARSTGMQQTMNLKIKYRESFRPFAPCVLKEHAHEVFDLRAGEESPYMLFVWPVKEELRIEPSEVEQDRMRDPDLRVRVAVPRSTVPAVTHVDYSARVQTVDEERHGRFYRLMRKFFERTGSPVVVNTSFNIRGEPIVCTPEEAFRCFMSTEMDALVLEDYILIKDRQDPAVQESRDMYLTTFELD